MALSDVGLLFKIKADSDQARSEMDKLRKSFDTDIKAIEKGGTNSFLKFGESIGLSSNQMAGLAKAAPIAGAAIAAIGAAAVAAGVALFALAQRTAEYGSKINDASLKTGLTAETLSGLDLQLKQSGTSMEAFTGSIFLMQKNLEKMADGSKEGTAALQKIGLSPGQLGDTEEVLRTVLKYLAAIPDESLRNAEGARIMGRSYQELAVFVADTNGNIDAAIEKSRELGLVMSQDAAKKADEFGDKLDELSNRAEGMGRTFGFVVMPAILDAMNIIGDSFKQLPDIVEGATFAMNHLMKQYVIFPLVMIQNEINRVKSAFGTMSSMIAGAVQQRQTMEGAGSGAGGAAFSLPRGGGGGGGGGRGGGGRRKAAETDEERALKLLKQLEEQQQKSTVTTELARVSLKLLEEGYHSLSDATRHAILTTARAIDVQKAKEVSDKKLAKAQEMFVNFIKQQRAEMDEIHGIHRTALDDVDDLVDAFKKMEVAIDPVQVELMKMTAIAISGAEAVNRLKEALESGAEAAAFSGMALPGGLSGVDPNNPAGALGVPPPGGGGVDWGALTQTIADTLGTSTGVIQQFGSMATAVFGQVAQAVGDAVHAFVLFGTAGGGLKKFAAQLIASIAQMAAVQAVWELAQGFAKLALNFFWPDPKLALAATAHFHAAAIFGAIAGVAAVGGRAVAGNSFAQGAGGGGGGGGQPGQGGGTAGGGSAARETNVIDLERNRPAPIDVNVRVDLHTNDAHIIDSVVSNVNNDGRLRKMIVGMVEG